MLHAELREIICRRFYNSGPRLVFYINKSYRSFTESGCTGNEGSLVPLLTPNPFSRPRSHSTRIASPASSWIDDFFDWIDPEGSPLCCRVYLNSTEHCPDSEPVSKCRTCPVQLYDGRPSSEDFYHYLGYFLDQNPGPNCPKA